MTLTQAVDKYGYLINFYEGDHCSKELYRLFNNTCSNCVFYQYGICELSSSNFSKVYNIAKNLYPELLV